MFYVRRQNSQKVMMRSEVGLHLSSLQEGEEVELGDWSKGMIP